MLWERRNDIERAVEAYSRGATLYSQSEDSKNSSNKEYLRIGEELHYRRALISTASDPAQLVIWKRL